MRCCRFLGDSDLTRRLSAFFAGSIGNIDDRSGVQPSLRAMAGLPGEEAAETKAGAAQEQRGQRQRLRDCHRRFHRRVLQAGMLRGGSGGSRGGAAAAAATARLLL